MRFTVRRVVPFVLPMLILPVAAVAAPKIGTVTSSQNAVVARDGRVVPAVANMSLFQGDKLMTRANGSANVSFGDHSTRLGSSSMLPMSGDRSVLSFNGASSSGSVNGARPFGGDQSRSDFLRRLAAFQRFIRDHRCHMGPPHIFQAGWGGGQDWDNDDDHDRGGPHGEDDHHGDHGHHGNPHCPPVSP